MNLNFLQTYIGVHSPGYIIETFKNNTTKEYIIGNKTTYLEAKPLHSNTLYDIASLTKTFTATLIYMAYEENKLKLNDKINSIDSDFKYLNDITIIDLLGFKKEIWTKGYLGDAKSKEEFYKTLHSAYVKSDKRNYIDANYIILSTLLEKIYNISYDKIVEEKIKNKLNLASLTFDPKGDIAPTSDETLPNGKIITFSYGDTHDTKARTARKLGIYTGHASIFINASDLLKFLKSFLDNSLLKKETIELMLQHDDINFENYELLKKITQSDGDINKLYKIIKKNTEIDIPKTYNNMGNRYRNLIDEVNDVSANASENTVVFSGYTGPRYLIDFDRKIIIVIMCNVTNHNTLYREERKQITCEIMTNIYNQIL